MKTPARALPSIPISPSLQKAGIRFRASLVVGDRRFDGMIFVMSRRYHWVLWTGTPEDEPQRVKAGKEKSYIRAYDALCGGLAEIVRDDVLDLACSE
jgi:hypothetical protein